MYYERDYDGDFSEFERELEKAGITKEEFDITNYAGATYRQLQSIVKSAIANKQKKAANE